MILLEEAIEKARTNILKNTAWKPSVKEKYYYGVNNLKHFAERKGYDDLCQELVDEYLKDETVKNTTVNDRAIFVKVIDRYAGSRLLKPNGILLNDADFPNDEDTAAYFENKKLPTSEPVEIVYLFSYALNLIRKIGLSDSTYGQYVHGYHCLYPLFLKADKLSYDEDFVVELIRKNDEEYASGDIEQWVHKIRRRSLYILIEICNTGKLDWHMYTENRESYSRDIIAAKNAYIDSISENNLSSKSIALHDFVFRKLIDFLNVDDATELKSVNRETVEKMMKKFNNHFSLRSMETISPMIKRILCFLYESGYMSHNFAGMIMSVNHFTEYNPAVLSKEDESRIVDSLNSLPVRDQAIMMLGIRYGLRDSDICKLKLLDIDWYSDRISICQSKTAEPLSLPLLDDVGNLIMDYIMNHRPQSDSDYIFLTRTRPFRRLESAYGLCSRYLEKINVSPVTGKGKGIHVFRYSLVKRLLESRISHQVITDSLGHSSKESDHYYLSLEEDKLRACCLDARWIGVKSWK